MLVAHCVHQARLATPDKNGVAMRAHVEARANRGDTKAQRQLCGPPAPERLTYLWEWFGELNAGRRVGMNGLEPLAYVDIDAWARLTDRTSVLDARDIAALMTLDRAWRHPESVTAADRDTDDETNDEVDG